VTPIQLGKPGESGRFLVTPQWQLGRDQTIVLPYADDIRAQLVPQR